MSIVLQSREPSAEDVKLIQEWLRSQPHLPDHMDETFIRKFLYRCNHSLQVTKEYIDTFLSVRTHLHEIFTNRDPLSDEFQNVIKVIDAVRAPDVTKENCMISIYRLLDPRPEKYNMFSTLKYGYMLADLTIKFDPLFDGEICIFDTQGVTMKHSTQVVLSAIRPISTYSQAGLPINICQVHVLNTLSISDTLFGMYKHLLRDDHKKRVHFHRPNSTTLFDFVPRNLIPYEYGGTAGSMEDFKNTCIDRIIDKRDFFLNEANWKVDETKRPGEERAENLLNQGSFKTLDID